jgi:methionyl-tRNA formyltransferase
MNELTDIIMLGANTARTKAYLQHLARSGNIPSQVLIMSMEPQILIAEAEEYRIACGSSISKLSESFEIDEPVMYTLISNEIPYRFILTDSVNSPETIEAISIINASYVIYSGFGGQILKSDVLSLGKRFLHVHPGVVPYYRGSTTIYYSLLKEGAIGASAIFLDEKLDCGALLKTKWYDFSDQKHDFDYIVDPLIRASLLVEVIEQYKNKGYFETEAQDESVGETYYIIHPVLKHIAMMSL